MLSAQTRPAEHGSRTLTISPTPSLDAGPSSDPQPGEAREQSLPPSVPVGTVGVLRLRGGPIRRQRVVWSEETIDNEGMGKKKSKICCIYHKPRKFDESSSESDSCESDDDHNHDNDQTHLRGQKVAGTSQRSRPTSNGAGTVIHDSRNDGSSSAFEESESESDGGGGDGRARPTFKPRRKPHSHPPKANKYDVQPTPKGKDKA